MGREMIIDVVPDDKPEEMAIDAPPHEVRKLVHPDEAAAIFWKYQAEEVESYLQRSTTGLRGIELVEINGVVTVVVGFEKIGFWASEVRENLRNILPSYIYPGLQFEEVRIFVPRL
ncbi:hypothetical protein Dda_9348 [Drechslerella dactyloides]|uniref:Uncharacterized protein n=1 Tax=Drechslerella dactyloides TaxID=74499 RepID=A0AAD6IQD4_DREDA|nr:hypothetical protein Dda_9348 [Drechslerella dactyloides]